MRLLGVLNVTPDSFSDGGRFVEPAMAVEHALRMVEQGADAVDIGGESTRPGSRPVPTQLEIDRVVPVIEALRARTDAMISVDTSKSAVAEAALRAGADVVNDVTALGDPEMAGVVARFEAGLVLMHMRGTPETMQQGDLSTGDVVLDVAGFLVERGKRAVDAGVPEDAICVDPGIGFGKTVAQNLALVARLSELVALRRPVLLGVSRKSFLGAVTGRPVEERGYGTAAACAAGVLAGAHVLRVHDVAEMRDVALVASAIGGAR